MKRRDLGAPAVQVFASKKKNLVGCFTIDLVNRIIRQASGKLLPETLLGLDWPSLSLTDSSSFDRQPVILHKPLIKEIMA